MLSRSTARRAVHPLTRGYATLVKGQGRAEILSKRPDDVVITFAKRTALGRAKKGQLKDVPVDKLLYALFKVRSYTYAPCPKPANVLHCCQATFEKTKLNPALLQDICVGV